MNLASLFRRRRPRPPIACPRSGWEVRTYSADHPERLPVLEHFGAQRSIADMMSVVVRRYARADTRRVVLFNRSENRVEYDTAGRGDPR